MKNITLRFCLEYRKEVVPNGDYVIKCSIHHPMFADNWWVIQSFDKKPKKETVDDVITITKRAMDIMLHNFRFNRPSIDNEHNFQDWSK